MKKSEIIAENIKRMNIVKNMYKEDSDSFLVAEDILKYLTLLEQAYKSEELKDK